MTSLGVCWFSSRLIGLLNRVFLYSYGTRAQRSLSGHTQVSGPIQCYWTGSPKTENADFKLQLGTNYVHIRFLTIVFFFIIHINTNIQFKNICNKIKIPFSRLVIVLVIGFNGNNAICLFIYSFQLVKPNIYILCLRWFSIQKKLLHGENSHAL